MIKGVLPNIAKRLQLVLDEMQERGYPMRITSTNRTFAEQNKLYNQGRTSPGAKVTNARGGESYHNYQVAADFCFDSKTPYEGPWDIFGEVGEKYGFEWGGRWAKFPDRPHLQMTFGKSISTLKNLGEIRALAMLRQLDTELPDISAKKPVIIRPDWEKKAMKWAIDNGIASVWTNPDEILTHEDVATMLHNARLLQSLPKDEHGRHRGLRKVELVEVIRKILTS